MAIRASTTYQVTDIGGLFNILLVLFHGNVVSILILHLGVKGTKISS